MLLHTPLKCSLSKSFPYIVSVYKSYLIDKNENSLHNKSISSTSNVCCFWIYFAHGHTSVWEVNEDFSHTTIYS